MAIKIKEIYGYNLLYEESSRKFIVQDNNGTELASANIQAEAEVKAKALSKQDFKRIPIVEIGHEGQITTGELTSLNKDDKSAWVSMEKSKGGWSGGRQKINLRYTHNYYEATEANLKILEGIKAKREAVDNILAEIKDLKDTLEKPIDLSYFGLER